MSLMAPSREKRKLRPAAWLTIMVGCLGLLSLLAGCGSEKTHNLSGRVTTGSIALAGVTVTLSGDASRTTSTDANGDFFFSDLPVGSYLVTPSQTGFTFAPVSRPAWLNGIDGKGFDFNAYYPNHLAISDHSMYLNPNGTLLAWGNNSQGQLGIGSTSPSPSPLPSPVGGGLPTVTAVANGASHTLALTSDGSVWSWGANDHGQLGDGSTTMRATPLQVAGLSGVTAIAAGFAHSLAVKNDGTVWAWGSNSLGQLGNGDATATDSKEPVQVPGLSGKGVAAGHDHSVLMALDNSVWTWGGNSNGQLGNGTTSNSLSPILVSTVGSVAAIAAGGYHTVVLRKELANFRVWCWGKNSDGQLGDGTSSDRSAPVAASGLTEVTAVAAGLNHTVAVMNDGTVRAWGGNSSGQLGNGTTAGSAVPVAVSGLSSVLSVAAGNDDTVVMSLDNSLWSWGNNGSGQLGDGTTTASALPVRVVLP